MIRRRAALLLIGVILLSALTACGGSGADGESTVPEQTEEASVGQSDQDEESIEAGSGEGGESEEAGNADTAAGSMEGSRPQLLGGSSELQEIGVTPCVAPYTVEPDMSNVDNLWQFYLDDEMKSRLVKNGFVVCGIAGNEFFEIYERDRYEQIAHFVTVDSLMHTYHLYFSHLLKNVEKTALADSVSDLGSRMLADSLAQYDRLKGSEWENAAKRNVAFLRWEQN